MSGGCLFCNMVLEVQYQSVKNIAFTRIRQKFRASFHSYPDNLAKIEINRTNFKHLQYSCGHTICKVDKSQPLDMV